MILIQVKYKGRKLDRLVTVHQRNAAVESEVCAESTGRGRIERKK